MALLASADKRICLDGGGERERRAAHTAQGRGCSRPSISGFRIHRLLTGPGPPAQRPLGCNHGYPDKPRAVTQAVPARQSHRRLKNRIPRQRRHVCACFRLRLSVCLCACNGGRDVKSRSCRCTWVQGSIITHVRGTNDIKVHGKGLQTNTHADNSNLVDSAAIFDKHFPFQQRKPPQENKENDNVQHRRIYGLVNGKVGQYNVI